MSSEVLSGSSNPSYTNNTGQNVRLKLNFLKNPTTVSWAGVTLTVNSATQPAPKQIILASTQSFSAVCGAYNIIVIKEDGT